MAERRIIAVVLLAGVTAAMTLGALTPFLAQLSDEFALPFAMTGWLASGVTLVAGLTCMPVGQWADTRRLRGPFIAGLLILAAAGMASASVSHSEALIVLRVGQGVGYAAVVVLGPALLARLLRAERARLALALWGMCVPVGLALASVMGGLLSASGWRASATAVGGLALVTAGVARLALPDVAGRPRQAVRGRGRGVWPLAAAFALIALVGVAVVTLLSTFLSTVHGLAVSDAGLVTGVVAASSALGSMAAGALLNAGVAPQRLLAAVMPMAAVAAGVLLAGSTVVAALSAAALMALNGLAVSALFAMVPVVAGDRTAWAAGALTQLGSLGTLLGPPLYAAVVERSGWAALVPVTILVVAVGLGCAVAALRLAEPGAAKPR
ncbi:MFS transporter [Nonomuraea cavernae]|uniref:MFS transporter n=1 Tax=Nonomuraea cavernae TaxID=2045107 RepID=UPI0033CDC250